MDGKEIVSGLMSNPLDLREIFYSNLLLLGFDSQAEETNYRIPLNRDMFVYPNKKAMEIVCHFLFSQLDAQLAFQEFRDCWHVQDKKMEQQFRKSCISWLSKIYKEEQDFNLPRIGPSLFLSPGGDRFYELMFYFSSFVLRKVIARDHGKHGTIPYVCKKTARNPNMTRISSKAVTVKTICEKDRFFKDVQLGLEVQEHWKSYAASSTKEYRKLCKEIRELERRVNPKGFVSHLKDKSTFEEEAEALRRTKKLQEVRELWLKLGTFYTSSKERRTVLNEILEGYEETFCIDGSEIQLQIPEILMTEYKHYIQMKNIGNTYQAGKLNLLSLIQLCSLALHQLKERIKKDGIQSFEQFIPFLKDEVHGHAAHLTNAQNLRSTLVNEVIPELKKSIENMKEECYAHSNERIHSPAVIVESFNFGLGLLPSTPSPAFEATGQPVCSSEIPENSLRKTPHNRGTPDVVKSLTTSIREMVVKGNKELDETKFNGKHISERSVEGSETPKPFFSKIPKPVNRKLSQTPDGISRRSRTTTKRMTVSTTKKLNKHENTRKFATSTTTSITNSVSATKSVLGEKNSMKKHQGARTKLFPVVTKKDVMGEQTTPLRTGSKSALKKNPSTARHILAEKIAKAVFADEPTIGAGNSSSQSSSGENTPKDTGVADPVGNLGKQPFVSKNLIPRTPFKAGSELTQDEKDDGLEVCEEEKDQENRPFSPPQFTPFKHDVFPKDSNIFSPASTPAHSPLSTSARDNAKYSTPEATKLISMSWKTPFATPHGTLSSCYTPIESKLTVVDINTPYAVTPQTTRYLNQTANLSTSAMTESTRNPAAIDSILNEQTIADLDNVYGEPRGSLHDRLNPVVPSTTDSPLLGDRNLRSDIFSVPPPKKTASEDGISLLNSSPLSTRASNPAHSPIEPSDSVARSFYTDSTSNVDRTEDSGTLLSGPINVGVIDKQLTAPFKVYDRSPPTVKSDLSKAGVLVPTTSSPIRIPEKPSLSNDLLLRYQRLKKAQEITKTASSPNSHEDDDDATTPPHSSWSVITTSRAFTTPETRSLGNNDRLFGETPLFETAPPIDLNANSVDDRERAKSRLFFERTPELPSLMDTNPIHCESLLLEESMNKSGTCLDSEGNIFEGKELNLIQVEIGDWYEDKLDSNPHSFSVGKNHEDRKRRTSFEFVQPREQNNLSVEIMNDETLPSPTVVSAKVGRLIDFD